MKNKKFYLVILLALVFLLTGCTKQMKDANGKVVRDDRVIAKQSMLDANPVLKNLYSAEDDNTEVLYFENAKATFYSFTEAPRVVEF